MHNCDCSACRLCFREMYVVCPDALRNELLPLLAPSGSEGVFSQFPVLPKQKNVLVAIESVEDENLRAAIRHFLVNADGWPKLAVAKKHWNAEEKLKMEEVVESIREKAAQICEAAIQKAQKLPSGEWKDDRMEQLGQWKDIPSVEYGTVDLGHAMQQNLKEILPQFQPFELAHDDKETINSKPPVLHWPPEPLDGELQVILRIVFPISGPDENTFREICRNLRQYGEHVYEWTTGILTSTDVIRLHVERVKPSVIQISGRLALDELEGEAADKPISQMWPYLAVALKETLAAVQHVQNMPYNIDLIPYGTQFYQPPIDSRVFELTQFMATANAYKKVATKLDGKIHEVDMKLLLPDGPFTSLASLLALEPPTTRVSRSSSMQEAATKDEIAPMEQQITNGGLTVAHNKGRRVSFGSIKLMNDAAVPIVNEVDAFVDGIVKESLNLKSLYVD